MMKIARTRKMFAVLTILLVMSLFESGQSFAWTTTLSFEGGTVGAVAKGGNGFTSDAGPKTTFSNDYAHSGTMSAKMAWSTGDEGFPNDMGQVTFPAVPSGGEIWARGYFYFPTGWSWANAGGGWGVIKTLRLYSTSSASNSIFFDNTGMLVLSNEPGERQNPNTPITYSTKTYGDIGKWQCLEIYVKFSSGSGGIIRIWKNGILVLEDVGYKTTPSGGSGVSSYVMSYWNSGVSKTQNQYLDDFVYTSDTPSNVDAHGNHMIGPIDWNSGPSGPGIPGGVGVTIKSK